jgi:hypothetical protein
MFYDKAGFPSYWSKNQRYLQWDPTSGALPSWLSAKGASPILTFGGLNSRGALRFQTKSSTPTAGDEAGVITSVIDPSQFAEIGLFFNSVVVDTNTNTDVTHVLSWNTGTQGFYLQSQYDLNDTRIRIYPAAAVTYRLSLVKNNQGTRQKDIGFLMRNNGDLFITAGDPYKGGAILSYHAGAWLTTPTAISMSVITRTAAQRYGETTGISLLLGSN